MSFRILSIHSAAVLLIALMPAAVPAQLPESNEIQEIVVEAPRSAPMRVERSPYGGEPIVTTTIRIPVFYDDLDVRDPATLAKLMKRIEWVAHDACMQLDRLLPFDPDPLCVERAVARSKPAAVAAMAVAR